uniref:Uncharacterized protein n=1 Tax=Picea glauca TaxID=3330 RepID=A0A117NIJ4_PICGL|nr:hypothetical protein ABT39_MTgene3261 [Picea glauca]QHR89238.1 hypothetical protein Q903MT_gene3258 [Picea sitchensis]
MQLKRLKPGLLGKLKQAQLTRDLNNVPPPHLCIFICGRN